MSHDWGFDLGDVAREQDAKFGPMGDKLPKDEYKIDRRFIDDDTGDAFYQVETEESGTHVFSEGVLDNRYEPIPVEESRVWPKEN
jgi:hypothetical protein